MIETQEDGSPKLMWFKMKMTGMSTRDCIQTHDRFVVEGNKVLFINSSIEDDRYPISDAIIRMEQFKASLCWDTDEGLQIIVFSSMDMKGWFPVRLLNMMIGAMAAAGIKEQVK